MKKCILAIPFVFLIAIVHAQPIDSVLKRYANEFIQEKAYLHYDKSSYYPGETIWFKAYLMEGIYPAESSRTFYVDWIGDNGTVLYHSVSPVVDGSTNGQFEIPADYTGSAIHVRAYTRWMLNFDTAFLYSRDIRILSREQESSRSARLPAVVPSLQFFPEGGEAIAGISNKIAFKAADQWGRPVRIRGVILDAKGSTVDSIVSVHDGMGIFLFTPEAGGRYTARWKDENGKQHQTVLPAIQSAGITMQVMLNGTRRTVQVEGTKDLPEHQKTLHLVGTTSQHLAFKTEIRLTPGNPVRRVIPTENLPSGILTITLFDANWNAVAERITFVNNNDFSFSPEMEVKHWGLGRRKRNEIELTLPENVDAASLSVSVTDAAIERDTTENIISRFLLSGEIRGKVFNPAYYFSSVSDSVQMQLDLVMLTNGWRRFKWEELTRGKFPEIKYPRDTAYLTLSGQLFGVAKTQLSGNDNIVLLTKEKDSISRMLIMPIQKNGTFNDPSVILFDTLQVYYSLKSKLFSNAEARFMTERLPPPNYTAFSRNFHSYQPVGDTTGIAYHQKLASKSLEIDEIRRGRVMETVVVRTKQKSTISEMDDKYAHGLFKGLDGYQFNLVDDPSAMGSMNILNYLQGRVAGLQINMSGGQPTLFWRNGAPLIYLDEIQTDAGMITSIPVTDIAYVKVFRPPFMGGFGGANGAIAIYTRKGNDATNTPGKGLSSNKVVGYTPIREFYSPNYDRFDPRNDALDIRTTLYWNPVVNKDPKSRKIRISFYNNDSAQAFRVVVEGMTPAGLFTHFEQIME